MAAGAVSESLSCMYLLHLVFLSHCVCVCVCVHACVHACGCGCACVRGMCCLSVCGCTMHGCPSPSSPPFPSQVSHKADQNLNQQHMALLYMKRELDKHIRRLEERVRDGNEQAMAASQTLASKVLQIEQVLPYLQKCIKVNRQAELQTIAVLQKVKDEDLNNCKAEKTEEDGDEVPRPSPEKADTEASSLNVTLTADDNTPEKASPQSPHAVKTSTPVEQRPPPMPVKLSRTHTSDSAVSQSSEIFIPKGGILTPEEFIQHVKTGQRPGSANSQKSEGATTPVSGSPIVLTPKKFTRSVSSGTPNAVEVGGAGGGRQSNRPGSASGSRGHKVRTTPPRGLSEAYVPPGDFWRRVPLWGSLEAISN